MNGDIVAYCFMRMMKICRVHEWSNVLLEKKKRNREERERKRWDFVKERIYKDMQVALFILFPDL